MQINVNTKFNIGDLVYAVRPYWELDSCSEVLCGRSDNTFDKEKYPLRIVEVSVSWQRYFAHEDETMSIQYNLVYANDPYNSWDRFENVSESDLFSTYEDALKELSDRKDKARAEAGW